MAREFDESVFKSCKKILWKFPNFFQTFLLKIPDKEIILEISLLRAIF